MRLFLAIEIPQSIRTDLAAHGNSNRQDLPGARWVSVDRMHLTLVFLGDLDDAAEDRLVAAIEPVGRRHAPLRLAIATPGTFPPGRPAKVAWIGLSPSAELDDLQADLHRAVEGELEPPSRGRRFHAHLTLARCKQPWPRWAVERWSSAPVACVGQEFAVTYVDLMKSRLTPSGPDYQCLRRFALGG